MQIQIHIQIEIQNTFIVGGKLILLTHFSSLDCVLSSTAAAAALYFTYFVAFTYQLIVFSFVFLFSSAFVFVFFCICICLLSSTVALYSAFFVASKYLIVLSKYIVWNLICSLYLALQYLFNRIHILCCILSVCCVLFQRQQKSFTKQRIRSALKCVNFLSPFLARRQYIRWLSRTLLIPDFASKEPACSI